MNMQEFCYNISDMYHQPSKRKQLIQRIVTYAFMTISVVTLVTVLVFIMLGYQFNSDDGKIEQGGLVQFDSRPTGANVTIDGMNFSTRTPSKTTMAAGQHYVTVSRSGYDMWQKSITVVPGSVLWLNYTRLIPSNLSPANVADFKTVSSAEPSPNAKTMAIKESPTTPELLLADLTRDDIKTAKLVFPGASYTLSPGDKKQRFSIEKWSFDSRYILVKHTYGNKKTEWIVVDSQDAAQTKNVTTLLDVDASKLVFDEGNSRILYAQIDTDVRKIDLGAATLSRPLVRNVAEFSVYDRSTIVFSTVLDPETKQRSVGYYIDGDEKPYTIRTYTDNGRAPLHLALGKYFGDMYEAIAYGNTVELLKGDLPKTDKASQSLRSIRKMQMPGGVDFLSIETDGRFLVVQNGATYKMYDLELKKETATTLEGSNPVKDRLKWLDNYTLWSDRSGILRLYEFDGANQHDIMPVAPGFGATLSPNAKYLYGINKSKDGAYHLERVRMILP